MNASHPVWQNVCKALANIYIEVEEITAPSDIRDSRPRTIPDDIAAAYINFATALDTWFGLEEGTILKGARPYIREAIGLSGFNIGYVDEGLNLAQMVTRASPTGYGVHYQSNIRYRG